MNIVYKLLLLLFLTFALATPSTEAAVATTTQEQQLKPESVNPGQKPSKATLKTLKERYKVATKGMKLKEKKAFLKMKLAEADAEKPNRLTMLLWGLGFILLGAILIFAAYNTIGYLGFIAAVIGIIILTMWLIFKEADKD